MIESGINYLVGHNVSRQGFHVAIECVKVANIVWAKGLPEL